MRRDNEWPPVEEVEAQEFDEEERLSREKLKGWQALQVAKGFVDNTINRVMERYIMASTGSFFLEDPWMRSFRGDEMEDTAVSMAIRNHGLVPLNNLSQSNSFFAGTTVNFFSNQDCSNYPLNSSEIANNFSGSTSTSSSSAPATSSQVDVSPERNWIEEKTDESDQEHDFLERAVAEAIKKKGLSTLSVDYG